MSITATQYLFKASLLTATTTATVGAYTVPASTRGQVVTLTLTNAAANNAVGFCDVSLWDGATAYPLLVKGQMYPGGSLIVESIARHVLPTGGAIYATPYATTGISAIMTVVELI